MKVSSVQSLIASKQVAFITIWQAHIVTNRVRNYIYAHIYKDDNVPRSHRTATLLRTSATLNLVWWLWSLAIAAWSRSIAVLRSHRKTDCSRSPCLCATRNHGRQSCHVYRDADHLPSVVEAALDKGSLLWVFRVPSWFDTSIISWRTNLL